MTSNKVIIVTGASRGIGLAATRYLLTRSSPPCNVVIVARTAPPLETLREEFPERVETLVGSLGVARSSSSLPPYGLEKRVTEAAEKRWGRIDGLVINHAVLAPVGRVVTGDAGVEGWEQVFRVNLFSGIALIRAAAPLLRKAKGRIIFTSSGAAVRAYSAWGAYGASKAALNHLAMTLAAEEPDITTISIRPGVVDTEMQEEIRNVHPGHMDRVDIDKFNSLHQTGKLLTPEQPGNVIARLALNGKKELSGKFESWDDIVLDEF